jgi:hypothetical protein
MENELFAKFNIYDILGILIPGVSGIVAFGLLSIHIFNQPMPFNDNTALAIFFYLFLAIFFGVVSHELGHIFEKYVFIKFVWKKYPHETFLLKDNQLINDDMKDVLVGIANDYYKLKVEPSNFKSVRQFYGLIFASIKASGRDSYVNTMYAQHGLARNSFAGILAIGITYLILTVQSLNNRSEFIFNGIITIALFVILIIFFYRIRRFDENKVRQIIYNFYDCYIKNKK